MPQRFENVIYTEGFDDYEHGKRKENCHYTECSKEYFDYMSGWNDAKSFWSD